MKIFVTGGSGFVGRNLISRLIGQGHTVTVLSRSEKVVERLSRGTSLVLGDPTEVGPWQESLKGKDCIINLAGTSIFSRWTPETKKLIRESRISKGMWFFSAHPLWATTGFTEMKCSRRNPLLGMGAH
jgi:NAD dependent epimerase/dehydratase family enzyme